MESLGGLDDATKNTEDTVVSLEEKKEKRRPFHFWTVNGRTYQLKLKSSTVDKLEAKYHRNIMNMLDDIPPLSVMLTIIQAAMEPWQHGMSYMKVQNVYEIWADEEGGNQSDLYTKVVLPTLAVSGFFTAEQAETLMQEIGNV